MGRSAEEGIGYPLQYFWASLVVQLVRMHLQCGRPGFDLWVGKIWRRERLPTLVFCPEEFQELCSLWGCKKLETTEQLSLSEPNSDMRYDLSNFLSPVWRITRVLSLSLAPHGVTLGSAQLHLCGLVSPNDRQSKTVTGAQRLPLGDQSPSCPWSNIHLMVVRPLHVTRTDLQTLPQGSQLPKEASWPKGAKCPFIHQS